MANSSSLLRHTLLLTAFALGACGTSDADPLDPENPNYEREGWRIVDVSDRGDGCVMVTYEGPPEWDCSEEHLEKRRSWTGSWDMGMAPAFTLDDPGELVHAECVDLAKLRRESLRAAEKKELEAAYALGLWPCEPTRDFRYFREGEPVAWCGPSDPYDDYYDAGYDGGVSASGGTSSGAVDGGATDYSTTNNQVAGVEEADYLKNDSGHVYVLQGRELVVFDAWPVEDAREIARLPFENEPRRLLLAGDRLVVFLRATGQGSDAAFLTQNPSSQGCTYGYDCRFQSEGGSTEVRVFDVSQPAALRLVDSREFSGAFVATRRIEDTVHLVLHDSVSPRLFLNSERQELGGQSSVEEFDRKRVELEAQIEERVDALSDEELLPKEKEESSCGDFYQAVGADGQSLVSLVSFRISDPAVVNRTTIASNPGFVYSSAEAFYLAVDGPGTSYWNDTASDVSLVHKFLLGDERSAYRGSSTLRGHVLNQFAMDEKGGILRVATTSGWVPHPDVSSTITTLTDDARGFRRLAELRGLAPTEDIRSVRFDGDRGFVVTFKKTDPLFVIGLSDPARPEVLGELKIPGFSTYMHPLDADHLLAVGFDADDQGGFAYFEGIQVQIFDVSELSKPRLAHKMVIGTRGSGSEALMNHLAFNYFPSRRVLALPVTLCGGGEGGSSFGDRMSFTGVLALDVDVTSGIRERGRLPFAAPSQDYEYGNAGCWQWWSASTSAVKRTIFFDDYLFGISDAEIRAAHLDGLSEVLATLPLTAGAE